MLRMRSVPNRNTKNQPLWFTFSKQRRLWSFHVVVLQRTAKKSTKNYNAHAQLLFCSSNLLFGDILVPVAVVFCVRSLIYRGREQHGKGREAGDKGTGSGRAGYGRREVLTPLSPPLPKHFSFSQTSSQWLRQSDYSACISILVELIADSVRCFSQVRLKPCISIGVEFFLYMSV